MKQKTFGNTRIVDVELTGTKCECGNNSVVMIDNNDTITHYCRNCARKTWLEEREKYE